MLNSTTIKQLNRALENSFAAIKKDIHEVKLAVSIQAERNAASQKVLETVKADSVTSDKLNVLKIKVGELNEGLKKVWDLEKQIKSTGSNKALQHDIDELNAKFIGLNIRLAEVGKTAVTESQLKTLLSQINAELNTLASTIRDAEMRRDEVRRQDIDQHTQKVLQRVAATNQELAEVKKDLKSCLNKNDTKKILDDINNEFDDVKKQISSLYKRDATFVREGEVKDILKHINKEFDGVAQELAALKKQSKEFVTAGQIKGLIDDISNEFNDIRADLVKISNKESVSKKDVDTLRKTFENAQKDMKNAVSKDEFSKQIKHINKELESHDIPESYGASVVLAPKVAAKKVTYEKQRKKYVFGNFMIFVSFMLLIASIVSFYFNEQLLMDNFAIGAVAVFLLGMILRIYAVVKSSKV
jgi:uncharacterized coiled-coil DUF342 family protein